MANTIRLRRSSVQGKAPTTSDIQLGELAVNTYDGKLYTKKSAGGVDSIVEIGATAGGAAGPVLEAAYVISQDVTLTTTCHGLSLISVEVSGGYSVTVPGGTTWTIALL